MLFLLAFFAILFLDQGSKFLVRGFLEVGEDHPLIDSFLSITYFQNDGAAFSSMRGRRWLLIAFSVVIIVVALVFLFRLRRKQEDRLFAVALLFVAAGGMGNLIDRLVFGYVTDMIRVSFFPPIFNVADCFVVIGCMLAVLSVLLENKDRGKRS